MELEYTIVRNFIDSSTCDILVNKLDNFLKSGYNVSPDVYCPNSPTFYGIFNDEAVEWLPKIEELTGKSLSPTYTYSRIYTKGEILLPHTDRPECEYSFTLALKYDKEIWPFYIQTEDGPKEIMLDNGDMLLYNGPRNLHWRMRLENDFHYQAFFHYVDNNGPYVNNKYDNRGEFATTEQIKKEIVRSKNVL
jgi:hypothetical protein